MDIPHHALMSRLQTQNPQGYQIASQAMQNNGNPMNMIQQVMGGMSDEQKGNFFKQCKSYGVPSSILTQIQNMK